MHPVKILFLLVLINSAPFLTIMSFPRAGQWPLDAGMVLRDGHCLLGRHKTIVGFASGIIAGAIGALLVGFSVWTGVIAGLLGMLGDSFSSFIKRRLNAPAGSEMPMLDPVFEAALPLLYFHYTYSRSWAEFWVTLALFMVIVWLVAGIRESVFSPANADHPRFIRSARRFRKWRACHTALSPYARLLNFENVIYYRWLMAGVFKGMGLYARGRRNALDVRIKNVDLSLPGLPKAFSPYRILFMSDLHIDGIDGLADRLIGLVRSVDADVCLLGGDYRMEMYGSFLSAKQSLGEIVRHIRARDGVYGILGNHDCLGIAPDLEDSGLYMLINDSVAIERDGARVYIAGVDDPHYYRCHSLEAAYRDVPEDAFSILLAHSPEILHDMKGQQSDLCLCGHTHGGQIRLPGIGAVFTHCKTPRQFTAGRWQYNGMIGYTSNGAGSSGIPLRFNCPPEIVLLTLTAA